MKKFAMIMLAAVLMLSVAVAQPQYSEPVIEDGVYKLTEDGNYVVGSNGSIPAGLYQVSAEGFNARVYLPDSTVISSTGIVLLEPVDSVSFTVDPGTYTAGADFPAGSYSIESAGGLGCSVEIHDADGGLLLAEYLTNNEGERVGKIDIPDGASMEIGSGAAHFAPASGITFD